MTDRRTGLAIAGAAAMTFAAVYALWSPPAPPLKQTVTIPRGGGPARQALAEARTAALYAENEARPRSEVEPEPEPEPDNAVNEEECVGAACDVTED